MKDSIKTALISAFLYPGLGHIYLKNYVLGSLIALSFSVPVYIVVDDKLTKVTEIIKPVIAAKIPIDLVELTGSLNQVIYSLDSTELKKSLIAIMIIWLIAIIDSYRLALTQSKIKT